MPVGYRPRGQDFPRRNRLISSISVGVVVEAAQRSGSLITARLAGGYNGREDFFVPGNPLDPRVAATNKLLMDGAGLVTCATDIIDVLTPILGRDIELPPDKGQAFDTESGKPPRMDISRSERELVIDALSFAPVDIDEIIRTTRLPASQVQVILLELDLARYLKRHGSQLVSLGETERDNATRTDFGLKPFPAVYGVFLDDQFQRIRRGR